MFYENLFIFINKIKFKILRHKKNKDGLGHEFNCAFTSEFIEINEQNCIIGSAYLLAMKVAICIRDVYGRLSDYWSEFDILQDSVHVWLKQEYKKVLTVHPFVAQISFLQKMKFKKSI